MRLFLLLSFFLFSHHSQARCELQPKDELVIACTYKCALEYRLRITFAARAMGYPVRVVDLRDLGTLSEALEKVDGVVIPGGADIDPVLYTDKVTPELRAYTENNLHLVVFTDEGKIRDPYEYAFVKKYLEDDTLASLPLLGICRGMQMMTVGQGIPLYLDIKTELGIKNRRYLFDRISVEKGTNLDTVYKNDSFRAFKLHHQGLRVPYFLEHASNYPDVRLSAISHGGKIAEGIEFLSRPALGVQYHPEKSFTNAAAPIFRWLLTKSCERKNLKAQK